MPNVTLSPIILRDTDGTDKDLLEELSLLKTDGTKAVKISGNQTVSGTKTFETSPLVPDKNTAATDTGTILATEAQVYSVDQKATLKYTKPSTGIPKEDLATSVRDSLGKADQAEPAFIKNTGFNKNFGSEVETVCEGNDTRLSNARPANGGNADTVDNLHASDFATAAQGIKADTAIQEIPEATTEVSGTSTLGTLGGAARYGNKSDVGLSNVTNEKQYSEISPPPYPVVSVASKTGAIVLDKLDVGLANVDNTSDLNKPLSTAAINALALKANQSALELTNTAVVVAQTTANEAKSIAQGRSKAKVFTTEAEFDTWIAVQTNRDTLSVGDSILIEALNTPDYWWNGTTAVESEAAKVDLTDYYIKAEVDTAVQVKYTKPETGIPKTDLADSVKASLGKANTAVQVELDPTVPAWAKQATKPSYAKSDVGLANVDDTSDEQKVSTTGNPIKIALDSKVDIVSGKGLSANDYTTPEKTKLAGIAAGAQVNTLTSVAGRTGAVVLSKSDVELTNADNTSDLNKPVSTATQAALKTKVNVEAGKGLFSNEEKDKLSKIGDLANFNLPSNGSGVLKIINGEEGKQLTYEVRTVDIATTSAVGGIKLKNEPSNMPSGAELGATLSSVFYGDVKLGQTDNIARVEIPTGVGDRHGLVKLSDSVTSTSGIASEVAATPAAVKSVKDSLDTHAGVTGSGTVKGHVFLSDDTHSDGNVNNGTAATPYALKSAMETHRAEKGKSTSLGHVQLSDLITNTDGADSGVAATPLAVRTAYTDLNNSLNTHKKPYACTIGANPVISGIPNFTWTGTVGNYSYGITGHGKGESINGLTGASALKICNVKTYSLVSGTKFEEVYDSAVVDLVYETVTVYSNVISPTYLVVIW